MPHVVTEVSRTAKQWGFRPWGLLWPSLLSSVGRSGIGTFNKRTPRKNMKRFGTLTFTPLNPQPHHSTHSLASYYTSLTRISPLPHPSGEGRGSKTPRLGIIQLDRHPRCLHSLDFGFSPTFRLGLWGTATLLPGKNCTGQIARGPYLGTPVLRQEAAPPWSTPSHPTHDSQKAEDPCAPSEQGYRAPQ